MDQSWDDVLIEFISRFSTAEDETAYVMAIAELSARLQDSHVFFNHPVLARIWGFYDPPIRVDLVEGKTVITKIYDPELKKKGLTEGDAVLKIDDQVTENRRDFLARFFSASTPGRLNTFIDLYFLAGYPNSNFNLTFRKKTGKIKKITLSRSAPMNFRRAAPPSLPIYTVLPEGFGYIDLGRLMPIDVDKALETIKDTPGLILDMRGYPRGGASILGKKLCKEKAVRARIELIEYEGIEGQFKREEEFQYINPSSEGPFSYNGKIAVLIGNSSQSAAEHTCLMLEVVADVTFIGSPTSGANGNITHTVLPGGIYISFTGVCVQHADGRQLQRLGIQPDIRVEPTIEGVLAGRDEVLKQAVKFLNKETNK